MTQATVKMPVSALDPSSDPEVDLAVEMLRAALERLPEYKRQAVIDRLVDMMPKSKVPQRGGPILDNVINLFRERPAQEISAAAVVAALADRGITATPKPVYNALNYLNGMRIIKRVGYGRYIMEGGGMLTTNDREGP